MEDNAPLSNGNEEKKKSTIKRRIVTSSMRALEHGFYHAANRQRVSFVVNVCRLVPASFFFFSQRSSQRVHGARVPIMLPPQGQARACVNE